MNPNRHALVVGGSGMLAGVCGELVRRGWFVSVVARNRDRLQKLAELCAEPSEGVSTQDRKGRLNPISVDYTDLGALDFALDVAERTAGPVQLGVLWVRSSQSPTIRALGQRLHASSASAAIVHVRGSAASRPDLANKDEAWLRSRFGKTYHRVVLGFVIENGAARWLTHDEIYRGVLDAVDEGRLDAVVGTVEPWEQRP